MKECKYCKKIKDEQEFYNKVSCKQCRNRKRRTNYQENKLNGLCGTCGKQKPPNQSVCNKCKDRMSDWRIELKKKVLSHYGEYCQNCGESHTEFLCIDHINADGNSHRKKFKYGGRGREIYSWLRAKNYPNGFQVLCMNCNMVKERGVRIFDDTEAKLSGSLQKCCRCGEIKDTIDFAWNPLRNRTHYFCKDCRRLEGRVRHKKFKKLIIDSYGGVCECCGESELDFLTIDHIEGNGSKHRKEIGDEKGLKIYKWLYDNYNPKGFRVLCMNCNFAIGIFGHCPHEDQSLGAHSN
jgi:hypothetical protein